MRLQELVGRPITQKKRAITVRARLELGRRTGLGLLAFAALIPLIASRNGEASRVHAPARTKVNPSDGLTYVWIAAGTFRMGCSPGDSECSDNENPVHTVTIRKGFWIGQTPVTQAAYTKVIGANPSQYRGEQFPVEEVTWDDAAAYCRRVQSRLPTEAQWEYAARGGTAGARYAAIESIAWYSDNAASGTHPVAQKQTNAFGVYDMLGNVREWVADWYGPYNAAAAVDPKGPATGEFHVSRGGSWYDSAQIARASSRWNNGGGCGPACHGFRCASD